MKNLIFLCLAFLLSSNIINAQTDTIPGMSKFTLYGEAATLGIVNSLFVNVEGKINSSDSQKVHWYGRAGFGYVDILTLIFCEGQTAFGGLSGFTMITGKGDHHFEAFGGVFLGSFKTKNNDVSLLGKCGNAGFGIIPLLDLGYRYQKPESGLFFRAKIGVLGLGIGLGHAF